MPNPVHRKKLGKRRARPVSGTVCSDSFETYTTGNPVQGLNGGTNGTTIQWAGPWAGRASFMSIWVNDDFQGYTNGANVSGLNGGSSGLGSWASPYAVA